MTEIAPSIDLNLAEKLQDRSYRQKFFLAEASASIAGQLIALRKRRELDQGHLAKLVGTQQPAISRIEKADYQNWSFNTLRKIAAALDARIKVVIEPAEDVLPSYEEQSEAPLDLMPEYQGTTGAQGFSVLVIPASNFSGSNTINAVTIGSSTYAEPNPVNIGAHRYSFSRFKVPWPTTKERQGQSAQDKDQLIADLLAEIVRLQQPLDSGQVTGAVSPIFLWDDVQLINRMTGLTQT